MSAILACINSALDFPTVESSAGSCLLMLLTATMS